MTKPEMVIHRLAAIDAEIEAIHKNAWQQVDALEAEKRAIVFTVSAYETQIVTAACDAAAVTVAVQPEPEHPQPVIPSIPKHLTPADYILQSMKRIGPATVNEIRKDLNGAIEPNANLSAWFSILSRRHQAERLTGGLWKAL